MITQERLLEVVEYQDNGSLLWKPRPPGESGWNKTLEGSLAGSLDSNGYSKISIDGERIPTHRAVFLLFNGYLPEIIDHIDNNPSNNRIENLRAATREQNAFNRKAPNVTNLLGVKNVSKRGNSFRVKISKSGQNFMKTCKTLEEAIEWRDEKLKELHGEFASKGDK